jgi:two-component system CheB/CheR fusion protein
MPAVHLFDEIVDAEAAIATEGPHLVVLIGVDEPTLAFCRRLRKGKAAETVTVLIAVPAEKQDQLSAILDAGADDYIIVPLHESRIEARIGLAAEKASEKVRRAFTEQQLASRVKQQSLVAELGQRGLAGAELAEVSDRAVEIVADALGIEYARVLRHIPEEGLLSMTAGVGWSDGAVGKFTLPADKRWQAGYTLLSSKPVITNDAMDEGRFGLVPFLIEHGVTSSISVIIPGREAPYGVLSGHSQRRRTFSEDDIHFMESVANVLAAVVDRTDKAATLERSEARARRLAAVASRTINGVMIADTDHRIEWVNEGFTRITGYTFDDVRGSVPGYLLEGPETDPETLGFIRERLSRNEGFTTELVNYKKSGEAYWVRIEVQPLVDKEGRGTGYMAIETDVTEQRIAEQALRESEARALAIVETTVDAIITIDVHGIIESFNPAAERIFRYRSSEVIGRNVKMLMPTPYYEEHDGYLASYLETGRRKIIGIGREVVGQRKDGSTFPMDLAVSEVQLADRIIFTAIIRDISERRELEQQVLEMSEQERRRIGQDLHDGLGQTLTGITLISNDLERRLRAAGVPEADQAAEITEMMKEADQQARGLARGLVPVELDADGLSSALRRLVANAERFFFIECRFEQIGDNRVRDNTAATHLYRIAQEAVSNAAKHGRATRVVITLASGEERVRLRIQDNGIGFPDVPTESQGIGVRTMHYRARIIGAMLDIRDHPEGGTVVTCTLRRTPRSGIMGGDALPTTHEHHEENSHR